MARAVRVSNPDGTDVARNPCHFSTTAQRATTRINEPSRASVSCILRFGIVVPSMDGFVEPLKKIDPASQEFIVGQVLFRPSPQNLVDRVSLIAAEFVVLNVSVVNRKTPRTLTRRPCRALSKRGYLPSVLRVALRTTPPHLQTTSRPRHSGDYFWSYRLRRCRKFQSARRIRFHCMPTRRPNFPEDQGTRRDQKLFNGVLFSGSSANNTNRAILSTSSPLFAKWKARIG
jgi:hypothetical protein